MHSITLIIPGLLPLPPGMEREHLPDTSALDRLLARADRFDASENYYQLLFEQFGLTAEPQPDYPLAALSHLADTGQAEGLWLRADPVHLSAGREGMVLFDSHMLHVEPEEARELSAALKPLLDEPEGMMLEMVHPHRWYLRLDQPPGIQTIPLAGVRGRDVSTRLPYGSDQTRWRQLFNESQMLLHETGVNSERARRGVLPVNSLWFWGPGELPRPASDCRIDAVFSDDVVVHGLAALHGVATHALPAGVSDVLQQANRAERILIVNDRGWAFSDYLDVGGWLAFIETLERDWMAPLYKALQRGRLRQLDILVPGYGFRVVPRHLWRFWRRSVQLSKL